MHVSVEPRPRVLHIVREILQIALPNIAGYVVALINELTNTVILGHVGDKAALAAIGLANMMQNCVAFSVGIGIVGALDTLVSQAHGARQHELSCQHLQRCRVLVTLQLVWMIPALWFSGDLLALVHQSPEVAARAGEYNRASVFGFFAFFQYESTRKFLQNREDVVPPAAIGGICSVLHIGWCCFFVVFLRLGNAGAGYANAVTWWTQFFAGTAYLAYVARRDGFRPRSLLFLERAAFKEWGSYMRFALPTTVQLCSEWWFWEVIALVVGYLGEIPLAAHVATLNWVTISFMPAIGVASSSATLVGNALGASLPRKARATAWTCVGVNVCFWTLIALGTALGRGLLSSLYSSDGEIQELMHKLLLIWAAVGYLDTSQNVLGGALRGLGWQRLAAATYIVAYYFLMLPGGILAAFPLHMGIFGIWGTLGVGTAIATLVFTLALGRIDFSAIAADVAARMETEGQRAAEFAKEVDQTPRDPLAVSVAS